MKLATKLILSAALIPSLASIAVAKELKTNTAQMQAMDKVTGRVKVIEVPVNGNINFGTFSILVRDCQTRPPEETPENYAFVDILDNNSDGSKANIFRGWMMSSTPALNAVEHPIYDVWLLKCINTNIDGTFLLTKEQLDERNLITKLPQETPKGQPVNLLANIEEEAKALFEQSQENLETETPKAIDDMVPQTTEVPFEPIENNIPTVVTENIEFKEAIENIEQTVEEKVARMPVVKTNVQSIPQYNTSTSEEGPVNLINIADEKESISLPDVREERIISIKEEKIIVKGLVPDNLDEATNVIFEEQAPKIIMTEEIFPLEKNINPTQEEGEDYSLENKEEYPPRHQDNSPEFDLVY